MNLPIFTALSFALLLAIACLVRETKLRRSLQRYKVSTQPAGGAKPGGGK